MNKELQRLLTDLEKFIYQSEKGEFTLDAHQVHLILDHIANQGEEIERLNNIINETRRLLGEYKHYSTPDEIQNKFNEEIVDKAYIKLHSNLKLKEGK